MAKAFRIPDVPSGEEQPIPRLGADRATRGTAGAIEFETSAGGQHGIH
jgi:hypothetical protein